MPAPSPTSRLPYSSTNIGRPSLPVVSSRSARVSSCSGVRSSRVSGAPSHGSSCRRPPTSRTSPRSRTALAGKAGRAGSGALKGAWPSGRVGVSVGRRCGSRRSAAGHGRRRAACRQCRQGVEEERPALGVEQADEMRLEGRAVAKGELAAQRQRRVDGLRSRLGLDPFERRRREVERRDAIDRRAELAVLGLAERRALLGELRLACRRQGDERAKRNDKSGTHRASERSSCWGRATPVARLSSFGPGAVPVADPRDGRCAPSSG